jgi:hypothetical protein
MPIQQIESAVRVDIRHKKGASFDWLHEEFDAQNNPQDLTGRTYTMIIDEWQASEIEIAGDIGTPAEWIVRYSKGATPMDALTVWDHSYIAKYTETGDVNEPYVYWIFTVYA